jgi:S1-C subfamily serine protease
MIGVAANILPGDSGGAVVNSAGQVIGMTTAGNGGQNSCGNSDGGLQSADRPGSGGSGRVPGADVPGGGSGDSGGQSDSTAGYAVPTNTAVGIVNQIRAGKASADVYIGETGFLGVQAQDLTQAAAERLGLPGSSGVLVIGFASSSPASDAGIPENSVITAVAGKAVTSTKTLQQALAQHKQGDKVSVSWTNASGSHSSTVTLGSGPPL